MRRLVVMQLEIPLGTVEYVVAEAAAHSVPVILNPAPARVLPDHLLKQVAILTPNQQEAEMLSGRADRRLGQCRAGCRGAGGERREDGHHHDGRRRGVVVGSAGSSSGWQRLW